MAVIQQTTITSSTFTFMGHNKLCFRNQNVSMPGKTSGIVRCVATPSTEKTSYKTQVSRNEHLAKLQAGYLFPEIGRRRFAHMLKHPDAKIISLEIGNTTEPIPEFITSAMAQRVHELSTLKGYSGYGAEQGEKQLRASIASTYYANVGLEEDEIFISDGAAASREHLTKLVPKRIVLSDSVARLTGCHCVSSFSQYAGFTGVWLGWTAIPKALVYSDGFPVAKDFNRIVCTSFNGASNIAQAGGLGCLSPDGFKVVGYYKENKEIIMDAFNSLGYKVYGVKNAPYVWVHFLGRSSWEVFREILEKTHVVTTPGSGFGPGGEGFVRVSAFGHRENVIEPCRRFKELYQ